MPICSRCGGEIEFRYIDGRCIPLHFSGGCGGAARSAVYDYAGYNRSKEGCCFLTKCPECREPVYFIRHNGGSVWIDPPLGPPWYKHGCMDNGYVAARGERSPVLTESALAKFKQRDGLIIGIVKEVETSDSKRCSLINIEAGRDRNIVLLIKNNAGFLAGCLVLYDQRSSAVSCVENDSYTFRVVARLKPRPVRSDTLGLQIACPECLGKVRTGDLSEHLKRQHRFPWAIALDQIPDRFPAPAPAPGVDRGAAEKTRGSQRVCPQPSRWNDVFMKLVEYAEKHSCKPRQPPVPLVLAGWAYSNDVEKMQRWTETVRWASTNGCAAIVQDVADIDFHRSEKPDGRPVGPLGGPCHRPWDFESKVRPTTEELATHLEHLLAHWADIAGPDLAAVTRPVTFTGKKARRLLAQAEKAASPPWGGWSHRLPEETKRRTFTRFRSAVNEAIAPHEVDHIEFVEVENSLVPKSNSPT